MEGYSLKGLLYIGKKRIMRDNPYYHTFAQYCRDNFGRRLYRVALDAGFTCPNRDGTAGTGGCIFCSAAGSGEYALEFHGQELTMDDIQPVLGERAKKQAQPGDFIGYFQSFSNTYAQAEKLRRIYRAVLANEIFAGISIATRPDCVGRDVLELFSELKAEFPDKFIWVELGLQTMHEKNAEFINRGYGLDTFEKCVRGLQEAGIPVIVHVIIGLPGETEEMMYRTTEYLNGLKIDGIKLHLLHILKGTKLYEMYIAQETCESGPEEGSPVISPMTFEEYTDIVCGCLERLSPEIVVHRLTGDGDKENLVAPLWSLEKGKVINSIRHKMKERGQNNKT